MPGPGRKYQNVREVSIFAAMSSQEAVAGTAIAVTNDAPVTPITLTGDVTMTATPTIAAGRDGQLAIIVNVDAVDSLVLQDEATLAGSLLQLGGGTRTLVPHSAIAIIYSTTLGAWFELGNSIPSGAGGGISGTGTDNHVMRWNGTTDAQDSDIVIDDDGNVYVNDNDAIYFKGGSGAASARIYNPDTLFLNDDLRIATLADLQIAGGPIYLGSLATYGGSFATTLRIGTGAADYVTIDHDSGIPLIQCAGTATNIDLLLKGKGSGLVKIKETATHSIIAASGLQRVLTTKGDLLVTDGTTSTRLAVGTNGHVLTADSAEVSGIKWAAPAIKLSTRRALYFTENPSVMTIPFHSVPVAATITRVTFGCVGTSTPTVTFNVDKRAENTPDTAGTNIFTTDEVAGTTFENITANSAGITARDWLVMDISAIGGAPSRFWCAVEYTLD